MKKNNPTKGPEFLEMRNFFERRYRKYFECPLCKGEFYNSVYRRYDYAGAESLCAQGRNW